LAINSPASAPSGSRAHSRSNNHGGAGRLAASTKSREHGRRAAPAPGETIARPRAAPLFPTGEGGPHEFVETFLGLAHTGGMVEDHQITVVVEPDLLRSGRYRWTLLRSGQAQDRSEMSFATRREADADAEKALKRRIAAWKAT
jgi:hypothetical protein